MVTERRDPKRLRLRWAALTATVAILTLGGRWAAIFSLGSSPSARPTSLERKLQSLERGYKLEVVREMQEEVTALSTAPGHFVSMTGRVFVGTAPLGGVYSFNLMYPQTYVTIGEGLGDYTRYGMCEVNSMAIRDLDRDGTPELMATTSQIVPQGRPRLYVWTLSYPSILRCMTRPQIQSSWSHGIGFLDFPGVPALSTFVTFCGNGEIVEYQLSRSTSQHGFAEESLGWKKVGQLPASGEWIQSCDVDHDGRVELCVASGYVAGKAAISVYSSAGPGTELRLERLVKEPEPFSNVRFIVGDTRGDGAADIVAWWCHEPDGGDSAVIRYRLAINGSIERRVLAEGTGEIYWPKDGQIAVMDHDGDHHPEVWFANNAGGLWRIDTSRSPAVTRIAQIKGGFGPIAAAEATAQTPPALLIGMGRKVLWLVNESMTNRRAPLPAQ